MYSKYIQQFLEDNDLQAGEKFYILGEDGEALNGKSNYYFKINPEGTLDILKCDSDRTCQDFVFLVVVYVIEILKCHFCGNMVENVLTKSIYKVDKEREDLINYINSLTKHKIPSELKYKLENEGKYLYGQYNSIK